ncbi:MAG: DUF1028 domain-containing protein [Planctomycetes bacterium]|nr:DUF1028 domain-containing protein [Planctomycetota bacterium]
MATPLHFGISRFLATAAAFALIAANALATWSIIIVDTSTGEVAIGQATCIPNFDLEAASAVVVIGKGAGCAQSFIDTTGQNRLTMFTDFQQEVPLSQILNQLIAQDFSAQLRQYGMVSIYNNGDAITFTGTGCGAYANGVVGQIGTLKYAIQGNVLTGQPVITLAEQAVINTPGDVGQKLLAAMQAAASMGGDGRCSCSPSNPTGCGSPPPTFTKSADTGYMLIGRMGDVDGTCNTTVGCASGTYYMNLKAIGGTTSPDPVLTLTSMYTIWRNGWRNHADHVKSTVTFGAAGLPADGMSQTTMTISLIDINGSPVNHGGANITVQHDTGSAGSCTIGPVTPVSNGIYNVQLTAGATKGMDKFKIVVNDGKGNVLLYPSPKIPISALCNNYGSGTPGAGNVVPGMMCSGASVVGNPNFGFVVQYTAPGSPVIAYAAQNPASIPFGTLGTLLIDPTTIAWGSLIVNSDINGLAAISASIPSDPALSGMHAYVQALILDPGAEIGVSATQGLDIELL